MTKNKNQFIVGIDEVGRGPVAGPVTVCAILMSVDAYKTFKESPQVEKLRDSKKLSEKKREEWSKKIKEWREYGMLDFSIFNMSSKGIDDYGISRSIQKCINKALVKLEVPVDAEILLDGGLVAEDKFINQKTIIRGDETEPIISLASIKAKVNRDNYMKRKAKEFPEYGLEKHKGYGTKANMASIQK